MMTFIKGLFTPKSTLLKKINNLERDVESLKKSYSSLLTRVNGLDSFCKETMDSVNSIFFEDKKEEYKQTKDKQDKQFGDTASVFDWGD